MDSNAQTPVRLGTIEKAKSLYSKYEHYLPAGFFIGGFLFDVFTLGRIDSLFTLLQQALYLILLLIILLQMLFETGKGWVLGPKWQWYVTWRIPAMHFIFGSLLSSYTLFFFMSASLSTSFLFMFFMVALLVGNEFHHVQSLGLTFKFALWSLSSMSYFIYVLPTVARQSSTMIFIASLIVGIAPSLWAYRWCVKKGLPEESVRVQVLRPSLMVLIVYLVAYIFRVIPPVPLSIQYMGIYHQIKKNPQGQYELSHERPWWRFWHSGDQQFNAQPGDKIVAFFRLFSPAEYRDEVRLVWYLKDPKLGWTVQDRIPIKITGGRDEGFRGYGAKGNYTTGDWRVSVETSDGREIGRLGFHLEAVPSSDRQFQTDFF